MDQFGRLEFLFIAVGVGIGIVIIPRKYPISKESTFAGGAPGSAEPMLGIPPTAVARELRGKITETRRPRHDWEYRWRGADAPLCAWERV